MPTFSNQLWKDSKPYSYGSKFKMNVKNRFSSLTWKKFNLNIFPCCFRSCCDYSDYNVINDGPLDLLFAFCQRNKSNSCTVDGHFSPQTVFYGCYYKCFHCLWSIHIQLRLINTNAITIRKTVISHPVL